MNMREEVKILRPLVVALKKRQDSASKERLLQLHPRVQRGLETPLLRWLWGAIAPPQRYLLLALVAIGQAERIFSYPGGLPPQEKVQALLAFLATTDRFYEPIGGLVGYQTVVLQLLLKNQGKRRFVRYTKCTGIDMTHPSREGDEALLEGLRALEEVGEVYPVGGLGSRLHLSTPNGQPLPVALLPFAGRTLLEGLVRDVQAREFLYYRLFNKQITLPIALMTSLEQQNRQHIRAVCERADWFGREEQDFLLFSQLSVPVVTEAGQWVLRAPLELQVEPGGHGALWRTAEERGIFAWFLHKGKHRLLIRQINNPIGGTNRGLLLLLGVGKKENKAFGFVSCDRLPHAAEGVLLLKEDKARQALSNVEYTDFCERELTGEEKEPHLANTNILYADLNQLQPIIQKNALPGLLLNMKKKVVSYDMEGHREFLGGRLESMMQNLSDLLSVKRGEPLPCFAIRNARKETISAAKRSFVPGGALLETPEGAFYDLLHNGYLLLKEHCQVDLPPFASQEAYLREGPSLLFLYHPALGPLYSIIAQKVRGGCFKEGAELQVEIADLVIQSLDLDGSLLIQADHLMGHRERGVLRYSQRTGKCILKRVHVSNLGIDRRRTRDYWKNGFYRQEAVSIVLRGHSEFYAEGVTFRGSQTIVVPDGERWVAAQDSNGRITYRKEPVGWEWDYTEITCIDP